MSDNLVIVESPSKAKKIQSYLGDGFVVRSSYGHVRDLPEKNISIDINGGFKPKYVIPAKQKNVVAELKKLSDKASVVWLASDEDREGEAIAWHLSEVLEIPESKIRRIVFHEITKPAILAAVEAPRSIDMNLVSAQQARRVMDRLVGFELSPVLWKKIQPKLSAGRVQSVALRLIVDREREIESFRSVPYYKVEGLFSHNGGASLKAVLDTQFPLLDQARDFLERSIGAHYTVSDVESKENMRYAAAPFTTSTLQQEAASKIGMSVNRTMQVAQKLYEEGLITYMRTDSVNLSSLALGTAKKYICENFGEIYSKPTQYKTSSKGAQEAHEAIRPTFIQNADIKGTAEERKLYQLIWRRTVASQMAPAKVLTTNVELSSDKVENKFRITGSQVLFDGFMKLYSESSDDAADDAQVLPVLNAGDSLDCSVISADCKFTQAPPRYNQRTFIKKLETLGIGRPSTYASIFSTLVKERGYVVEGDKEGCEQTVTSLTLKGSAIKVSTRSEKVGAEKKRLLPQDIGIMVNDYLVENFADVMDYGFTADVEKDFDEIAEGGKGWVDVVSTFYGPFHHQVDNALANTGYSRLERQIGVDPSDGLMITARYGQFGPYVSKGEGDARISASLPKGKIIESLTLEDAVKLFSLPRTLGQKDGDNIVILTGPYGPYMKVGKSNLRLPRGVDPYSITLEQALAIISKSATPAAPKVIAEWGGVQILEGSYGPYIKADGSNYKIPKGTDPYSLKEEDARQIIKNTAPTSKGRRQFKKK